MYEKVIDWLVKAAISCCLLYAADKFLKMETAIGQAATAVNELTTEMRLDDVREAELTTWRILVDNKLKELTTDVDLVTEATIGIATPEQIALIKNKRLK